MQTLPIWHLISSYGPLLSTLWHVLCSLGCSLADTTRDLSLWLPEFVSWIFSILFCLLGEPSLYFAVDDKFLDKLWEFNLRSNNASESSTVHQQTISAKIRLRFLLNYNLKSLWIPTKLYSYFLEIHWCSIFFHQLFSESNFPEESFQILDNASTVCLWYKTDVSLTPQNHFQAYSVPQCNGYMCTQPCTANV